MKAPKTFTGEDTIEISCHNNPFIIQNILDRFFQEGVRLAQPGEFSRQAVENGKIDIMQAEAIKELIHANSQESLKLSFAQLKGSFSARIQSLESVVIKAIALCEASFEFLEEDIDFSEQIRELLLFIKEEVINLQSLFDQQKQIREGIRIALIGSVNAGKSSLFNALIGKKRAIVTNIAGTTRDVIESSFYQDGKYWTMIDTAGLRTTNDVIEKEGIDRSYQEAELADIVLIIIDQSIVLSLSELSVYQALEAKFISKSIIVYNKADLPCKNNLFSHENAQLVSAQLGHGVQGLKTKIYAKTEELFAKNTSSFLLNKRHFDLLSSFDKELIATLDLLDASREYELISLHLQRALQLLSELSGKSISEKALDAVFKEFCVGK